MDTLKLDPTIFFGYKKSEREEKYCFLICFKCKLYLIYGWMETVLSFFGSFAEKIKNKYLKRCLWRCKEHWECGVSRFFVQEVTFDSISPEKLTFKEELPSKDVVVEVLLSLKQTRIAWKHSRLACIVLHNRCLQRKFKVPYTSHCP